MFNLLKKAWNTVKSMYVKATNLELQEEPVIIVETRVQEDAALHQARSMRYWSEFAEQVRIMEQYHRWEEQQERMKRRTDEESIRIWRENNAALNEVLPLVRRNKVKA